MSLKLIELNEASKYYLSTKFHFTINKGEFWLITGNNGSGKTTLLRLILDFTKPDIGFVKSIENLKISYLPEKVNLPHFLKAIEYLEMIAKIKKTELDFSLLTGLDIPLYKKINHLSKGNYQKVALAATLIGPSDLIVLDEPLSGLDKKMTNNIKAIIKQMQNQGRTFVVSTHNPKVFLSMSENHLKL